MDRPFVKALLGNMPATLLLDTGYSTTEIGPAYKSEYSDRMTDIKTTGFDFRGISDSALLRGMTISEISIPSHRINVNPNAGRECEYDGFVFDGVLGSRSMHQLTLRLLFDEGVVELSKRPLDPITDGQDQRFGYVEDCPGIPISMGPMIRALIDTGNVHALSLVHAHVKVLESRGGAIQFVDLGESESGTRLRRWALVRRVELGGAELLDAFGPIGNVSTIGLKTLSRYNVTIDYPNSKVAFQPRPNMPPRVPPDASGMVFRRTDEGTFVRDLYLNGAAYKAGLRTGDKVVSMDGKSIDNRAFGELHERLTRGGEEVVFVVDRAKPAADNRPAPTERKTFRFRLQWPFEWPPKWPEKPPVKKPIPVD